MLTGCVEITLPVGGCIGEDDSNAMEAEADVS